MASQTSSLFGSTSESTPKASSASTRSESHIKQGISSFMPTSSLNPSGSLFGDLSNTSSKPATGLFGTATASAASPSTPSEMPSKEYSIEPTSISASVSSFKLFSCFANASNAPSRPANGTLGEDRTSIASTSSPSVLLEVPSNPATVGSATAPSSKSRMPPLPAATGLPGATSTPLPPQSSIFKLTGSRSQTPFNDATGSSKPTSTFSRATLMPPSTLFGSPGTLSQLAGSKRSASTFTEPANRVAKKPKKNPVDFSTPQEVATIIADKGATERTFVIYKSLINHFSSFFKNELVQGNQVIKLEYVDSAAFGILVYWLYYQELKDGEGDEAPSVLLLAKVWALAELFNIPRLQNMAMEKLQAKLCLLSSWDDFIHVINFAYDETKQEDSPLRKLVAQKMAYGMRDGWIDEADKFPRDFMRDVLKVLFACYEQQPFKGAISYASVFFVKVEDEDE